MYSLLPTIVAVLFLVCGLYVVHQKGLNRVSTSFLVLCITTFFWQFTWAVLYQVNDPFTADFLIKVGYLLILFLPTSLYHFLSEITERQRELPFVYVSYVFAAFLGLLLLFTDLFINGHYDYFWGYYPKAGLIHPLHVLQTVIVVNRGLFITYQKQKIAKSSDKIKLRYCIVSLLIYFFAAADYLCNYGYEFYPPGVIFIAVSLGVIAVAITKYHLMDTAMLLAASVAHEMRTPLATIRLQAQNMASFWPILLQGYQAAVDNKLIEPKIKPQAFAILNELTNAIEYEVTRSNQAIDMFLASTGEDFSLNHVYTHFMISECVREAINRYPFPGDTREKIDILIDEDFQVYGNDVLLIYVLFNLLKNALYAIECAGKGDITITTVCSPKSNQLIVEDNGIGIDKETLPHIFDKFFSTKQQAGSCGIGLSFCRQVMRSFDGDIHCRSVLGEYSLFTLNFPPHSQ